MMLVKIIIPDVDTIGNWSMWNHILIQCQPASVKNTLRILPAKNGLSEGGSYDLPLSIARIIYSNLVKA